MSLSTLLAGIQRESALQVWSRAVQWQRILLPLHLPALDELLARLLARTPQQPFPILQLHGGADTGKSQLLLFIALVYALPGTFTVSLGDSKAAVWQMEAGGRAQGVIYLDLHMEFDALRIQTLAGHHFDRCAEVAGLLSTSNTVLLADGSTARADYAQIRNRFVQETLGRILVIRAHSMTQLLGALHMLPRRLRKQSTLDYGAIMVDPINAQYWQEKELASGARELDAQRKAIRDRFKQLASDWQLAAFVSSRVWMKRRGAGAVSEEQRRGTRANPCIAMDAWPGWWRDMPTTWHFLLERVTNQPAIGPPLGAENAEREAEKGDQDPPSTHFIARLLNRQGELTGDQISFEVATDGVFS